MVLAAQEGMDQAMPSQAKRGEAPQGPTAVRGWVSPSGSSSSHCLLPDPLQELESCFLTVFPAVRGARKSSKSNFLPESG